MRVSAILISVTALKIASATVVERQQCAARDEKCAGEADKPFFGFKECCDGTANVCATPANQAAGEWGRYCVSRTDANMATVVTSEVPSVTVETAVVTTAAVVTDADGSTVASDATTVAADATTVVGDDKTTKESLTAKITATETTASDDENTCFPAAATVELEDGSFVRMDALSVGDMVKVGPTEFSRVFMFTHKMADVTQKFVTLSTASGAELSLTAGHFIYANGALVAAKNVQIGDVLTLGNGDSTSVVSVASKTDAGLYNPQTVNGNVIVDSIMSSTYTTAVEPSFAHVVLAPFRMFQNFGLTFTTLESGGGVLAGVAPRGQDVL